MRGDVEDDQGTRIFNKFQSTPLREGRRGYIQLQGVTVGFNPRPCVRGDEHGLHAESILEAFQSTPLREGRRRDKALAFSAGRVSIHAPA